MHTATKLEAYRFGFRLFVLTQTVPFILIWATAYLFNGLYVSPRLNQWTGAAESLALVVSGLCATRAVAALRQSDGAGFLAGFKAAMLLGLVNLGLLAYQWGTRFVPVSSRFGEIYYILTGVSAFYTAVALAAMLLAFLRAARTGWGPHSYWDAEAAMTLWNFQVLMAVISYLIVYWI